MFSLRALVCFVPLLLSLAAAAPAQKQYEAPRVERETQLDEQGLLQWSEWQPVPCQKCQRTGKVECLQCWGIEGHETCLECGKTRQAPCRECGGSGHVPDPLVELVCPGCHGAGCFPCFVCGNQGTYEVKGGGSKPKKCAACKEAGGYECTVCDGDRLVRGAKLKPSVGEAELEDLRKARRVAEELLESVRGLEISGDFRDDVKAYTAKLKPARKYFPVLKRSGEMAAEVVGRLGKAAQWRGTAALQARALQRFATFTQLYLIHQMQVLDLCIARAEANAATLDKKNEK